MKEYFVEEFKSKNTYQEFIRYMLLNSDYFSFVYFKYSESEKTKKSTKEIKKLLEPYKFYSQNTCTWPGTITKNDGEHIYRLTVYKACTDVEKVLNRVQQIHEWQYPELPMDLCFYKNGYAWFASCTHENLNWIYISEHEAEHLNKLGIELFFQKDIDESALFYNEKLVAN